jgi:hypothetical protein
MIGRSETKDSLWDTLRLLWNERFYISKQWLHASLEGLLVETNNQLLKSLFTCDNTNQTLTIIIAITRIIIIIIIIWITNRKLIRAQNVFVGAKFRSQLLELMHKLSSWATHFIRCVKPSPKYDRKTVRRVRRGAHLIPIKMFWYNWYDTSLRVNANVTQISIN